MADMRPPPRDVRIAEYGQLGLGAIDETRAVEQLAFERGEEAFAHRVVVAISDRPRAVTDEVEVRLAARAGVREPEPDQDQKNKVRRADRDHVAQRETVHPRLHQQPRGNEPGQKRPAKDQRHVNAEVEALLEPLADTGPGQHVSMYVPRRPVFRQPEGGVIWSAVAPATAFDRGDASRRAAASAAA